MATATAKNFIQTSPSVARASASAAKNTRIQKVQAVRGNNTNRRNSPSRQWSYPRYETAAAQPARTPVRNIIRTGKTSAALAALGTSTRALTSWLWIAVIVKLSLLQMLFAIVALGGVYLANPDAGVATKAANWFVDGQKILYFCWVVSALFGLTAILVARYTMWGIRSLTANGFVVFITAIVFTIAPVINVFPWALLFFMYLAGSRVKQVFGG